MNRLSLIAAATWAAFIVATPAAFAASEPTKAAEPLRISHGQEIKLADYLVKGKTTIFDFTSQFCGPCRAIAPKLHKLHADRADIAVVEVDINRPDTKGIDWQSPVARQYDLRSIPHFKIFNPEGKLQAEGDGAYELVQTWVK